MCVREPGWHLLQQVFDHFLAFLQIDQQIIGTRQEDVLDVDHGDLMRLIVALGDAVEMHGTVVRNDADLCTRIARNIVQLLAEQLAHRF